MNKLFNKNKKILKDKNFRKNFKEKGNNVYIFISFTRLFFH